MTEEPIGQRVQRMVEISMAKDQKIEDALRILAALGFPRAQRNERSALCLLAITGMTPDRTWKHASEPLIGITPIMEFAADHYGKRYKPNTRETVRRQSMHQFVDAGLALYNPDDPQRPVNSPKAVYQISPEALALVRTYGSANWQTQLYVYLAERETLAARYAMEREHNMIPVQIAPGQEIKISPGDHSLLIKAIIEEFAPRFAPGSSLIYAGDTGEKMGYFDAEGLARLGVRVDNHGKMPDVVLFYRDKGWLLLVESVTSHGPVDGKRHGELTKLFQSSTAGLVYVTAFPNRSVMARYLGEIAWETEVWCASDPSHLIHFNGIRFLGPYSEAPGAKALTD